MRWLIPVLALLIVLPASANEPESDVRKAVRRSLKILADDTMVWKEDKKCASCHHVPMTLWTLHEARNRGFAIDDKVVRELTAWVFAKNDPAKLFPKEPNSDPKVTVNHGPLLLALGLEPGGAPSEPVRDGLKNSWRKW